MKKVLVLYYSQTGQLKDAINSFVSKLPDEQIQVHMRAIEPVNPYPYPWNYYEFTDEFAESVLMEGCEVKAVDYLDENYDLIILGYTIWFLAPSPAIVGFLKTKQAKKVFYDTPVVTLIACRDMWVMAQEKIKVLLANLDAKLIDNVALTDQGKGVLSLLTTPIWLLTGKKEAFGSLPAPGISQKDIDDASRFGERLNNALNEDKELEGKALLTNLGAVNVNGKFIAAEKIATRSSKIWAKLIKKCSEKKTVRRNIIMTFYSVFLVALAFTVIPLSMLIRKIINMFQEEKLRELEKKYEEPSGR